MKFPIPEDDHSIYRQLVLRYVTQALRNRAEPEDIPMAVPFSGVDDSDVDASRLLQLSVHVGSASARLRRRSDLLGACESALYCLSAGCLQDAAEKLAAHDRVTLREWAARERGYLDGQHEYTESFLKDCAAMLGLQNGVGRILRRALHTDRRLSDLDPRIQELRARHSDEDSP